MQVLHAAQRCIPNATARLSKGQTCYMLLHQSKTHSFVTVLGADLDVADSFIHFASCSFIWHTLKAFRVISLSVLRALLGLPSVIYGVCRQKRPAQPLLLHSFPT